VTDYGRPSISNESRSEIQKLANDFIPQSRGIVQEMVKLNQIGSARHDFLNLIASYTIFGRATKMYREISKATGAYEVLRRKYMDAVDILTSRLKREQALSPEEISNFKLRIFNFVRHTDQSNIYMSKGRLMSPRKGGESQFSVLSDDIDLIRNWLTERGLM
jgi:hypothetical protein